jgi:Fur family ferric uptake transcriptional regulator
MAIATRTVPGATRNTRQRAQVIGLLEQTDEFRSAQDLHAQLRATGDRIGLTTVYRALQALADAGEVDVTRLPNGEQAFRRCSTVHHHHLMCRSCARTVEIEGPAVEAWTQKVAAEHGFTNIGHTVEIYGICTPCTEAENEAETEAS